MEKHWTDRTKKETIARQREIFNICKSHNLIADTMWAGGYIVKAADSNNIHLAFKDSDYQVKGIGIGYDYNSNLYSLLVN